MRRKRQFGWESRAAVKLHQFGGVVSSVPILHHWPNRQQVIDAIGESHGNVCRGGKGGWYGSLGIRGGCRSRQPWGMLYHYSEKAPGLHVSMWVDTELDTRVKGRSTGGDNGQEGRGSAVGIRPQNMVVSYFVLTGRLLESCWSKSQLVPSRECISVSISRGSIC